MSAVVNLHCPTTDAPHRWSMGVYPTCQDCKAPRCDGTLGGAFAHARCHLAGNSAGNRFGQWYCPVHAGMRQNRYTGPPSRHPRPDLREATPGPVDLF